MKNKNELKNICPKEYCFLWREEGNQITQGVYMNLEDTFKNLELVEQSQCGCSFGICKRNEEFRDSSALDYYEPNEVKLKKDGLPWFYFIDYNQLNEKDKKQYDMFFIHFYKD